MKEPAQWFFALLNQAFKLDAEEKLKQLGVAAYPHMKQADAATLRKAYEQGARDILESLASYEDYSGIDKMKTQGL